MTWLDATGELSQHAALRLSRAPLVGARTHVFAMTQLLGQGANLPTGPRGPMPSQTAFTQHALHTSVQKPHRNNEPEQWINDAYNLLPRSASWAPPLLPACKRSFVRTAHAHTHACACNARVSSSWLTIGRQRSVVSASSHQASIEDPSVVDQHLRQAPQPSYHLLDQTVSDGFVCQ